MSIPEGIYEGQIEEAWVDGGDVMRIRFRCGITLTGGEETSVTAKHPVSGQWGQIGKGVMEHLDLDFPADLEHMDKAAGKPVLVRIKYKQRMGKTYENAYIETGAAGGRRATHDEISAAVAKMRKPSADADDVGF